MPQYLSDRDYQAYGGDLVNFSQRAAMQAVAPHLQALQDDNDLLRQKLAVEARARMDVALERAVPDFRTVDADPRWHQWLGTIDPLSGRVRQELLNEAAASGAINRVISFFNQFKNRAVGQGAQGQTWQRRQPSSGRTYTRAQIASLFAAHRKGKYAGREAAWAAQENDIMRAATEGRVLDPDNITK